MSATDPLAPAPRIAPTGIDGIAVTFADGFDDAANRAALALRAAVEAAGWPETVETAASLVSTVVRFTPRPGAAEAVRARLEALLATRDWRAEAAPGSMRLWTVPACFDPDLAPQIDAAAEAAGFPSRAAAVESLCAPALRVLAIGFAPGQPYLGTLPPAWDLPRQTRLTPRVPVGALGLAVRQMVLFSVETQTGWQHVGQTALRPFRPAAAAPFLLAAGDELRFEPVAPATLAGLRDDPLGGARCEVRP